MSIVKMTDILVQTSAFIVTLTRPAKAKSEMSENNTILEVTPIIQSATKDLGLAEKFFKIITSDSSHHNRRTKEKILTEFVQGSTKRILEEYWDTSNWKTITGICYVSTETMKK